MNVTRLTPGMRAILATAASGPTGTVALGKRGRQSGLALERRGLIEWIRDHPDPRFRVGTGVVPYRITDAGRAALGAGEAR